MNFIICNNVKERNPKIYDLNIEKNVFIEKLADKANEYYNTYHRTIKMKPVDLK